MVTVQCLTCSPIDPETSVAKRALHIGRHFRQKRIELVEKTPELPGGGTDERARRGCNSIEPNPLGTGRPNYFIARSMIFCLSTM